MTNQATNQHGVDDLLRAFRNILRGEAASGYADRTVIRGLDGFLATLQAEAASAPAVAALQREGLLAVGYAELPPAKRKRWADQTGRVLDSPLATPAREPAASPVPPAAKPRAKRPPTPIALDSPIEALKSVTRPTATKLRGMGIQTVRDLVFLFPTRHVDYSALRRIAEVVEGEEQTVVGALWEAKEIQLGANRRVRATAAVIGRRDGQPASRLVPAAVGGRQSAAGCEPRVRRGGAHAILRERQGQCVQRSEADGQPRVGGGGRPGNERAGQYGSPAARLSLDQGALPEDAPPHRARRVERRLRRRSTGGGRPSAQGSRREAGLVAAAARRRAGPLPRLPRRVRGGAAAARLRRVSSSCSWQSRRGGRVPRARRRASSWR